MMIENKQTRIMQIRNKAGALAAIASAAMMPAVVMAQDADPTGEIKAKVATYAGYAIALVIAFALAVWGLKAAGLLKRG